MMIRQEAKQEAIGDILKFRMTFRRSTLFMIREKYPDLDFSNINFTDIRGYNVFDPTDGLEPIGDLNVGGSVQVVPDQPVSREILELNGQVEGTEGVQVEGV